MNPMNVAGYCRFAVSGPKVPVDNTYYCVEVLVVASYLPVTSGTKFPLRVNTLGTFQ